MIKGILLVWIVCLVIYLTWCLIVYYLQKYFGLYDDTVKFLLNAGGVVMCVAAFIGGFLVG